MSRKYLESCFMLGSVLDEGLNEEENLDPETCTCPDCIDATGKVDPHCERCNGTGELFL